MGNVIQTGDGHPQGPPRPRDCRAYCSLSRSHTRAEAREELASATTSPRVASAGTETAARPKPRDWHPLSRSRTAIIELAVDKRTGSGPRDAHGL